MGITPGHRLAGGLILAGLAGAIVVGCGALGIGGNAPNAGPGLAGRQGTTVSIAKVVQGPITQTVAYSGSVQAGDSVSLVPKTAGRITKLDVDVGSTVKAGDVVAELDHTGLDAQLAQARAGVDAAQVKLAQIQAGARPESVAAAEANARAAKAHADALAGGGRGESIAQAKANLDSARAKLAAMQNGPRTETVAQAKANLDTAISKLNVLKNGPTPDQIAAGKLLVDQATNSLYAAQVSRDGNCGSGKSTSFQCLSAQASTNAAATALDVAQQNFKILTAPPTSEALNQAQIAVDQANDAYKLAQQPNTAQDIAQLQAAVVAATEAYQLAQQPNSSFDVAQAQAQADAASQQAKLAASPFTDLDLKAAQVAVEQAQAALAISQSNLADAQVVAPFDGVISARLLSLGALASTSTPVVTLMSRRLQVQFSVEEARIGDIKIDQAVDLTASTFPDRKFAARVASIYPAADPKTHTFTVVVEPTNPDGSLRAGMFVELKVILASHDKATLAPRTALVQKGAQQILFAVADGKAQLRTVTLGLSDDQNIEVVKGLASGEDVVTAGQASLNDGDAVRVAGATGPAGGTPAGGGRAGGTGAGASRPATGTPQPAAPATGTTPSPAASG